MLINGGNSGDHAYLVVRYEYTPGFEEIETVVAGGRTHAWLWDYVKLGATSTSTSDDSGTSDSSLSGADITFRKSANTWLKVEQATSNGAGQDTLVSQDGGYDFNNITQPVGENISANANRVDLSVGLNEIHESVGGSITAYKQDLEAGYSAPGIIALTETTQTGGMFTLPVTRAIHLRVKADNKEVDQGLETSAVEANFDYSFTNFWKVSAGYRKDERTDNSLVVPLTQRQGERSDGLLKVEYNSEADWLAYIYGQGTIEVTGNREENNRAGVGGAYRLTDNFKLKAEASGGDLGTAGKLGTEYLYSDRTNLYANYSLDNERADNGVRSRRGNMATGFRTKYSDSASVYMEEKYTHGDVPTGLTSTLGVDLAPDDRWNYGARIDIGTLQDNNTGATTNRKAYGLNVGYGYETIKLASAIEYRVDETEQADTTFTERATWLTKNSLKYQFTPSWRFISKLNHSESTSSLGDFYSGNFTEAVLGYGYRPVENDRLNTLFKYTYFYNLPTVDQVTIENTAVDFIQKSNIISLDVMYDLTKHWSLGGKYGYRHGVVAYDREDPEFFSNSAHLYVLRADWHFVHKWDFLIEGRALEQPDIGDRRSGALLGLYRHLGKHVKLGAGYNFTDFSDDLTDLDYDSRGWFINIIGKM